MHVGHRDRRSQLWPHRQACALQGGVSIRQQDVEQQRLAAQHTREQPVARRAVQRHHRRVTRERRRHRIESVQVLVEVRRRRVRDRFGLLFDFLLAFDACLVRRPDRRQRERNQQAAGRHDHLTAQRLSFEDSQGGSRDSSAGAAGRGRRLRGIHARAAGSYHSARTARRSRRDRSSCGSGRSRRRARGRGG